jgi:hypothetical protein
MTADEPRPDDEGCEVAEAEDAAVEVLFAKGVVGRGMADVENVVTGGIIWVLLTKVLVARVVWDVHVKGLVVGGDEVIEGRVVVRGDEVTRGLDVDAISGTLVAVIVACVSGSAPFTSLQMVYTLDVTLSMVSSEQDPYVQASAASPRVRPLVLLVRQRQERDVPSQQDPVLNSDWMKCLTQDSAQLGISWASHWSFSEDLQSATVIWARPTNTEATRRTLLRHSPQARSILRQD